MQPPGGCRPEARGKARYPTVRDHHLGQAASMSRLIRRDIRLLWARKVDREIIQVIAFSPWPTFFSPCKMWRRLESIGR